jgi:hypothetical protein
LKSGFLNADWFFVLIEIKLCQKRIFLKIMPKIDKVSWGKIKIDDQKYHQVLIIGDQIIERDKAKLKKLLGTDHLIGEWEKEELFSNQPEVILIASGWSGILKVDKEFRNEAKIKRIELKIVLTPRIVKEYHQLVKEGKRVNALIHTTC